MITVNIRRSKYIYCISVRAPNLIVKAYIGIIHIHADGMYRVRLGVISQFLLPRPAKLVIILLYGVVRRNGHKSTCICNCCIRYIWYALPVYVVVACYEIAFLFNYIETAYTHYLSYRCIVIRNSSSTLQCLI